MNAPTGGGLTGQGVGLPQPTGHLLHPLHGWAQGETGGLRDVCSLEIPFLSILVPGTPVHPLLTLLRAAMEVTY